MFLTDFLAPWFKNEKGEARQQKGKQGDKGGTKILVPRAGGLKLRLLKIVRCICPGNKVSKVL